MCTCECCLHTLFLYQMDLLIIRRIKSDIPKKYNLMAFLFARAFLQMIIDRVINLCKNGRGPFHLWHILRETSTIPTEGTANHLRIVSFDSSPTVPLYWISNCKRKHLLAIIYARWCRHHEWMSHQRWLSLNLDCKLRLNWEYLPMLHSLFTEPLSKGDCVTKVCSRCKPLDASWT